MNSLKKEIPMMAAIFVIAAIIAWIRMQSVDSGLSYISEKSIDASQTADEKMQQQTIPIIYTETLGRQMNIMHGYMGEAAGALVYDTLTVLPADRRLILHSRESDMTILRISYEIRSMDLKTLIEKTDVTESQTTPEGVDMVLPIQNLLKEYTQYRLDLSITTQEKGELHYYSAIEVADETVAGQIVDLADTFSLNNYDYDKARDNATYIETDNTSDQQTLGEVSLKSTYNQLTYNSISITPQDNRDIRLCSFDGNMGEVKIVSYATVTNSDGSNQIYEITESLTYRQGAERWYMMDYDRNMSAIDAFGNPTITKDMLDMGIQPKGSIQTMTDVDNSFIAISINGDLSRYDLKNNTYKTISCMRASQPNLIGDYYKHGIKILKVEDDGSMYYVIYGYMNTGSRAGCIGISLQHYDQTTDSITEVSYIPAECSYEELKENIDTLAYLGTNKVFYIKLGTYIYGIDTQSMERITICENLRDTMYATTTDKTTLKLLAWQDTDDKDGSEIIHVMTLDTGDKKEIHADDNQLIKALGFMNTDLVVGISDKDNIRMINGNKQDLPCSAIEIMDKNLTSQMHYEQQDRYISDISVGAEATTLKLIIKNSDGTFVTDKEDMIINRVSENSDESVFGDLETSITTEDEQLKHTLIKLGQTVNSTMNREMQLPRLVHESDSLNLSFGDKDYYRYIAYGHGDMIRSYDDISQAINIAYNQMGTVRYMNQIIYCRAATYSSKIIRNPENYVDELVELESSESISRIRGTHLKPTLYYISRGYPILTYNEQNQRILLYGYDAHNISVYNTIDGTFYKIGMEDAEYMFDNNYDDFALSFTFGS